MRKILNSYLTDDCVDIVEEYVFAMEYHSVVVNIPKTKLVLTDFHTNPCGYLKRILNYQRIDKEHNYMCVVKILRYVMYNSDIIYEHCGSHGWSILKRSIHSGIKSNLRNQFLMDHYYEMIMFKPIE